MRKVVPTICKLLSMHSHLLIVCSICTLLYLYQNWLCLYSCLFCICTYILIFVGRHDIHCSHNLPSQMSMHSSHYWQHLHSLVFELEFVVFVLVLFIDMYFCCICFNILIFVGEHDMRKVVLTICKVLSMYSDLLKRKKETCLYIFALESVVFVFHIFSKSQ